MLSLSEIVISLPLSNHHQLTGFPTGPFFVNCQVSSTDTDVEVTNFISRIIPSGSKTRDHGV